MNKQFTHFWFDMAGRVWIDQGGVYSLLSYSVQYKPGRAYRHWAHLNHPLFFNIPYIIIGT
jgi:hypothetical protein